ncbi:F-box domain protein [Aspergillus sclerotioniger CBS 115572]|uniref:F-box domain protein n=1 Tax=Aspergillus sclerotioniger CBS 115572 TaxID=1450535 RepID=A0A317VL32_9EURO|nr:F-box domain protein [Aspergillus sclerotioniger CBS 115572]PWY73901.1 F-box domain protein [Aspergillus sclerotioniger CBS 115572]
MSDKISLLPLELILHILSYLPFESLLAFGETSRANYESHTLCLSCLRLGVFEKRIHSVISLLQAGWTTPDQMAQIARLDKRENDYTISIVQPAINRLVSDAAGKPLLKIRDSKRQGPVLLEKSRTMEQMIREQNKIFAQVVTRYGRGLRKLEFMAYDLDSEGAMALAAGCQNILHHLALRFEHPHIREGPIRPSTWQNPAPGSTAWNFLIGIGRYQQLGLCGLQTLILERTGITPWQLTMLVKKNPKLTVLKLRTCRGAHPEFLNWLGGIAQDPDEPATEGNALAPGRKLKVLWLENCHEVLAHPVEDYEKLPGRHCDFGLEWVRGLTSLQSLSFCESSNLPPEYVDRANRMLWKIPEVIPPYSCHGDKAPIEVDPELL